MPDPSDASVPDFATACAKAREMEKNLLTAKPSPISGPLSIHPDEEIFPQEYESYTYAYLLSEAQKVERTLYMKGLQTSMSSQKPGAKSIDESKMEAELRKFAGAGELPQVPALPQEKQQAPVLPPSKAMPGGLRLPEIPLGKKKEEKGKTAAPPPPSPSGFSVTQTFRAKPPAIPITPGEAHEAEEIAEESVPQEAAEFEQEHPGYQPPEEEPEKPGSEPDFIGPEKEPQFSAKKQEEGASEPHFAAKRQEGKTRPGLSQITMDEDENLAVEREIPETSMPQAPPSASSASKLSPRLREIIEAKLRREEERKKKEAEILEGIELKPQEEGKKEAPQEEEIVLSARERLIRKLQKQSWQQAKPSLQPAQETVPSEPHEQEAPRQPEGDMHADEGQAQLEGEPSAEEEPAKTAPQESPSARKPKLPQEESAPALPSRAPAGGITIQPIFAGEESHVQSQPEKPAVESERLKKIQRIIEELSPDKYKAGAIAPREEQEGKGQANAKPGPIPRQMQEGDQPLPKAKPKLRLEQIEEEEQEEEVGPPSPKPGLQKGKAAPKTVPKSLGKKPQAKKQIAKETVPVSKKGKGKIQQKPAARKPAAVEEEMPARQQAKRTLPARAEPEEMGEETPQEEAAPTFAPKKRTLPREEAQAPAPKKRLLPSEEEANKQEAEGAQAPAPKKRILPQAPEPEEEMPPPKRGRVFPAPQAQPPVAAPIKVGKRILPGGSRPQVREEEEQVAETYVPPARQKLVPKMRQEEIEEESVSEEETEEEPMPQKPRVRMREEETGEPALARRQAPRGQEIEEEQIPVQKIPSGLPPAYGRAIPKKAADDAPVDEEPSPEQLAEERRRQQNAAALAAKLRLAQAKPAAVQQAPLTPGAPFSAKKTHDIAGEASLPEEEEEKIDEWEIPKPLQEGQGAAPADYSMAKGEFKRKLEEVEVKKKAKEHTDEFVEQYAKENLVWLYEIYKMGGMTRDDFMQKAREKLRESSQGAVPGGGPEAENPALSNLERELEKKKK
jgi:hypothetical protein